MRLRRSGGAALVVLALVTAGCSDDDGGEQGSTGGGTELPEGAVASQGRADDGDAAYAGPGDYAVGLTTLPLADRSVEVLYPAAEATGTPAEVPGLQPGTQVFRDAPVARGRFPVLLYSHGFAGFPLVSSNLQAGIASWGFVVAAPDHIERNTAALGRGDARSDPARDVQTMEEALAGLVAADRGDGVLAGAIDRSRVGSAGHSAGGGTALNALRLPEVTAAVTWAGVAPTDEPLPGEPVLVLGAEADIAVTGDEQREVYEALRTPKRLVQLDGGTGHATFLDGCPGARQEVIDSGQPRDQASGIVALAYDGCDADDADPLEAWKVIQHFTVAHLRVSLAVDEDPVGLGDAVLDDLPDIPVRYEHQP
ncbi:MAG TPA: dienelactone hydrolase family protein [Acidimicrobiales bacterium]|nr:dienelactone hydrolase family protein [Acidimicrobiales bacterium]